MKGFKNLVVFHSLKAICSFYLFVKEHSTSISSKLKSYQSQCALQFLSLNDLYCLLPSKMAYKNDKIFKVIYLEARCLFFTSIDSHKTFFLVEVPYLRACWI